jgi:hypothetical protein
MLAIASLPLRSGLKYQLAVWLSLLVVTVVVVAAFAIAVTLVARGWRLTP